MHAFGFSLVVLLLSTLAAAPVARGEEDLYTVRQTLNVANGMMSRGQLPEAEAILEDARAQSAQGSQVYFQAVFLNGLAFVYLKEGKYLEAEKAYKESIMLMGRSAGEHGTDQIQPQRNLANLYFESGRFSEAETLLHKDVSSQNAAGETAQEEGDADDLSLLGKVYLAEGKYSQAKEAAEGSLRAFAGAGVADGIGPALAYSVLGAVYNEYGEIQGAENSLQQSMSLLERALGPEDILVGEGIANLGLLYTSGGAMEKGEPLLERAWGILRKRTSNTAFTRQFLTAYAEVERKMGHKNKAKELSKEVRLLLAGSAESASSRYVVDVNRLR